MPHADLLKLLANQTNRDVLVLLRKEPTYPRRIAALLKKKEQKIVPRLKKMEETGLLKSAWVRVEGKNVKVYEVKADKMELVFGREGVEFGIHMNESKHVRPPPL